LERKNDRCAAAMAAKIKSGQKPRTKSDMVIILINKKAGYGKTGMSRTPDFRLEKKVKTAI
jgi:hypothetical protein